MIKAALRIFMVAMIPAISLAGAPLRSELSIHVRNGCVWLRVTDTNISKKLAYLPPGNPLVGITNSKGEEIRFNGIQPNRPPLTIGDYVTLRPGENHSMEFLLNSSYAIEIPGNYYVTLSGNYLDPIKDKIYDWPSVQTTFYYGGDCDLRIKKT